MASRSEGPLRASCQRFRYAFQRLLKQRTNHAFVAFAGDLQFEMQRLAAECDQCFFTHRRLGLETQPAFGFFGRPPDAGAGHGMVPPQIDAIVVLKGREQMLGQQVVEVVTPQLVISVTGQHFGDIAFQSHDRDVESSAAKVINHGIVPAAFSIGQTCRRRFVQDAHGLEASQLGRFSRGLPLRVGKVSGHGDDRLFDRLLECPAGPSGEFAQNQRRDLWRPKLPLSKRNRFAAAHLALDAAHGAFRIQHQLIACSLTHQQLARRR